MSPIARVTCAGVFGAAAISKIGEPASTVRAIRAYRLLPDGLVHPLAYALPSFELTLALLLLVGLASRFVGVISSTVVASFIAAVASAGARGLRIDCGCFGGGGSVAHTHYLIELARDALLLLIALVVAVAPTSRWSVDGLLSRSSRQAIHPAADSGRASQARVAAARDAAAKQRVRRRVRLARAAAVAGLALGSALGIGLNSAPATSATLITAPPGATAAGGIVVGSGSAPVHLIAYEDPQCPFCRQFEQINGATLKQAVAEGRVSVEYRMRSFLGIESARADNALAAAQAEGKFEALREALFSHQPTERTGGYTTNDLLALGRSVGLADSAFVNSVRSMTYARWVSNVDDQASHDGDVSTPELIRVGGQLLTSAQTFDPQQFRAAIGIS